MEEAIKELQAIVSYLNSNVDCYAQKLVESPSAANNYFNSIKIDVYESVLWHVNERIKELQVENNPNDTV